MKSRLYIVIMAIASIFVLQGCEKSEFLNTKPLSSITTVAVFADPGLARAALLTNYLGLPEVFSVRGGVPLDMNTGDATNYFNWPEVNNFKNNDYNAGSFAPGLNSIWTENYMYIRQTSTFLKDLEGSNFDAITKLPLVAEARALRATFYYRLYSLYGGVPLITEPYSMTDSTGYTLKRNTRDEVAAFIIKEFTESAVDLPVKRTGIDVGRFEKGAALGMKARILLYEASLKNDASLFKQAAEAAKSVMDLNRYSLYADYGKLFLSKASSSPANNEYMLYYHYSPNTIYGFRRGGWNVVNAPVSGGGWGGNAPSLALIDEFEMSDGKPYNESPLYDNKKPYDNRDPRFYASFYYQGSTFKGKPFELWKGGKDYYIEGNKVTTGFYIKKGVDESLPSYSASNYGTMDMYDPFLRYADVLLMYAEAQNEFAGPDASVYNAVNQVRTRAGMPAFPAGLTKELMRQKIRHERHVELNLEESFYHDIRRWGIVTEISNRDVWGQTIIKNADNSITFDKFLLETRTFDPKYILWPIPQSEIEKNRNLEQNSGY